MIAGPVRIDEDGRVGGMVQGALTVAAGCRVHVAGMIDGPLVVEPGAEVCISGMVNGGIDNRGGRVRVTGLVSG